MFSKWYGVIIYCFQGTQKQKAKDLAQPPTFACTLCELFADLLAFFQNFTSELEHVVFSKWNGVNLPPPMGYSAVMSRAGARTWLQPTGHGDMQGFDSSFAATLCTLSSVELS